ncbi:hypothetical protein BDV28DRAFT_74869 [Aspergillus coremiiformis]|uniref:Uncharacterized protein n=1 Tax=Aspergillus coremiiformis TaxID=138285 RepID=A0A5N6YTQ5_9EURO|nr:hypothetical protein BDV28DRAFT_74869 [Aspergillus coremiiformis]
MTIWDLLTGSEGALNGSIRIRTRNRYWVGSSFRVTFCKLACSRVLILLGIMTWLTKKENKKEKKKGIKRTKPKTKKRG